MSESSKTKAGLITEISSLKQKIKKLEKSEAKRKQAESQREAALTTMRESEEQYRATVNAVDDIIHVVDSDLRILLFNEAFARCLSELGIPDNIQGKGLFDLFPFLPEKVISEYQTVLKTGTMLFSDDATLIGASVRWTETRKIPIKDKDGKTYRIVTFIRDITERKQSEEALRNSERKYRGLTENINLGIYRNTVGPEGKFIEVNPAIIGMFGYGSKEEFLAINVSDLYQNPEDRKKFNDKMLKEGVVKGEELWLKKKDGSYFVGSVSAVAVKDVQGQVKYYDGIIDNIDNRKRAESQMEAALEALQESEERYRALVENASDLVYRTDKTGHFTFINRAALTMIGYEKRELFGKHYSTLIHPDMRKNAAALFGRQFKKGIPNTYSEFPILTKDGREVWLGQNSQLIAQDGQVTGFQAVSRDITERKRAESQREAALEALRESEERFRTLYENSTIGIYRTTPDGRIHLANPALITMLGYSSFADLATRDLEKNGFDLSYPRTRFIEMMEKDGGVKGMESAWTRKDGTIIFIRENASAIRDAQGKILYYDGTVEDITEHKQAESQREALHETLRESEARQQLILATLPIAIFTSPLDPAIDTSWISGDVEKVTGFTVDQYLAEKDFWRNRLHADDRERVLAAYRNPAAGDEIVLEYRWLCKDGNYKWFYDRTIKKRTQQGTQYFGIILDISERKQAEEEKRILEERLQWAEKMEAIGTLAGGIAHDFNNLLLGIQGYASLSLLNLDPAHPNYERLKRIEEQVQSGADLTSQLLGFARGGRYEVKPTDMNEIIEKTSSMFGRTKKEITIQRKHGKDLWSVEVDRGQMEQVLVNLYVNAWQAMSGGGEIYLETENVLLDDEKQLPYSVKPGKYVKITVTDTGIGMDEKTRVRIFDPFFTTKEMGRGIGLGLASVYGIIKGHQGMINVYSEPGHGTVFTIYLPASEKEVEKEETGTAEIVRGTETILLVEDEKIVMEVSRELLESMGYKVYAVGSGQEGIAVYMEKRNEIDLVILDMVMPGISGSETFNRLREINPGVRVLLSSGYSLNGEAQHIMDRGCNGFLQKPFQIEKLSQKVREMLEI